MHGQGCILLYMEAKPGGKTYCTQYAKSVFGKALIRLSDAADDTLCQIAETAETVNNTAVGICSHCVYGEIAALQVFRQLISKQYAIGVAMV